MKQLAFAVALCSTVFAHSASALVLAKCTDPLSSAKLELSRANTTAPILLTRKSGNAVPPTSCSGTYSDRNKSTGALLFGVSCALPSDAAPSKRGFNYSVEFHFSGAKMLRAELIGLRAGQHPKQKVIPVTCEK